MRAANYYTTAGQRISRRKLRIDKSIRILNGSVSQQKKNNSIQPGIELFFHKLRSTIVNTTEMALQKEV